MESGVIIHYDDVFARLGMHGLLGENAALQMCAAVATPEEAERALSRHQPVVLVFQVEVPYRAVLAWVVSPASRRSPCWRRRGTWWS